MKVFTRDQFNAHIRSLNLNERRSEGRQHVRMMISGNGFQTTGILTDIYLNDEEIAAFRAKPTFKVGETVWAIQNMEIIG